MKKLVLIALLTLCLTTVKAQSCQYPFYANYGCWISQFNFLTQFRSNPLQPNNDVVNAACVVFNSDTLLGHYAREWSNTIDIRSIGQYHIDSVYTFVKHKNYSGQTDTIIMQMYNLDNQGLPNENSIIWSDTIFTNQSLPADSAWWFINYDIYSWDGYVDTLSYISFPASIYINQQDFALGIKYFGSPLDTFHVFGSSQINFQFPYNIPSRYENSYLKSEPALPNWTKTSSIGYGNPVGADGWYYIQDWHMGVHLCETQALPDEISDLCMITADTSGLHYEFIWEKGTSPNIATYEVQEKATNGNFSTIHSQPYSQFSTYISTAPQPTLPYSYRLASKDALGNMLYLSPHHRPIVAYVNDSLSQTYINWYLYYGYDYTMQYIYRGTSPNNVALYDSVSTLTVNQYNRYLDPEPASYGNYYYQIEAVRLSPCNPSKSSQQRGARSISVRYSTVGITEEQALLNAINIYPNPAQNTLTIDLGKTSAEGATIQVLNTLGQVVKTIGFNKTSGQNLTVDLSGLATGLYFVQVQAFGGSKAFRVVKN